MNSRTKSRKVLRSLAGDRCRLCGDINKLHWHHVFPDTKIATVSSLYGRKAYLEAMKCILLCATCHRAVHSERVSLLCVWPDFLPVND